MATNLSRRGMLTGAAALALAPVAFTTSAQAQSQPASASRVTVPLSDARAIGPNSVRFAAAQGTERQPNIALFGVKKENWPTIRAGIEQSAANGFGPRMVFMGPMDAAPSMEIYAKGGLVDRTPVNPNTLTQARVAGLIRDAYAIAYPTRLASYPSPGQD